MKRWSSATPAIAIACLARGSRPDQRSAGHRYPTGRPGTFASHPGRAASAARAQ
jgi:hypothetical protein